MKFLKYLIVFTFFILFSCAPNDDEALPGIPDPAGFSPGVVLTLDDDYVENWASAQDILKVYNWKATFFITKCNQLSTDELTKLQEFNTYGHEIAAHGLNHFNAPQFFAADGAEAYIATEIQPMMKIMDDNGLHTTSFAYPFGARNAVTDATLLNNFRILRGTTYGSQSPEYQNCYYTGSKVVFGLGIDSSYPHFNIPYFLSILKYAKEHNKIVVFYAHKPVETSTADYQTEYKTLVEICKYVKANNMKFYKMSELCDL